MKILSVNYGNFLRKNEQRRSEYEFNRPIISFVASCVVVASLTALIISGAALAAAYAQEPTKNFDTEYFMKAQKLNTDLSKGIALMKEARPKEIHVDKVLHAFVTVKPSTVYLNEIAIQPGKYTVKGSAVSQDAVSGYASNLNFGKNLEVVITSVTSDASDAVKSTFTIEVREKVKVKGGVK